MFSTSDKQDSSRVICSAIYLYNQWEVGRSLIVSNIIYVQDFFASATALATSTNPDPVAISYPL